MVRKQDHTDLTYRKGVIGIVIDDEDNFLIIQSVDYKNNEWRFPGGGIEENEMPENALLRELREELGVNKFELLKKSNISVKYDWPRSLIEKRFRQKGQTYLGQEQSQYLVKYFGPKNEIRPNPEEIRQFKWIKFEDFKDYFRFPEQLENAKETIRDLEI